MTPGPAEPGIDLIRLPPTGRFRLVLGLTLECNMACTYCYVKPNGKGALEPALRAQALELAMASLLPGGVLSLGFFGGEPLLYLDALLDTLAEARLRAGREGKSLQSMLTTNGTLLDAEAIARLEAAQVFVTVSYDGIAPAHDRYRLMRSGAGTHTVVRRALAAAVQAGLKPTVNMVLDPATVGHLSAGVEDVASLGVTRVVLSPNYDAVWESGDLELLEREYTRIGQLYARWIRDERPVEVSFLDEKVRRAIRGGKADSEHCAFGVSELAIDADGRIFPCERLIRSGGGEDWVIGRLPEGIDPDRLARLRSPLAVQAEICTSCALEPFCSNSCPCVNLSRTGRVDQPDGLVCFVEDLAVRVAEEVVADFHPSLVAAIAGGA